MQKVIIDTNVIVSALISPGIPSRIINELVFEHKIELQLSEEILSEYVEVLIRPKFSKFPDFQLNAKIVISRLDDLAILSKPIEKLEIIHDESDNRFLELGLMCGANYLITGNITDFTMGFVGKTQIVTPSDYWHNYHPDKGTTLENKS